MTTALQIKLVNTFLICELSCPTSAVYSLDVWTLKKFATGFAFPAAFVWTGSTWKIDFINLIKLSFLCLKVYLMTQMSTWDASSCSDLMSLVLSWALGGALLANILMIPFWGLPGGFEIVLASPFILGFFCSGSSSRAWWAPLACCSSREDMGTAPEQRMAP